MDLQGLSELTDKCSKIVDKEIPSGRFIVIVATWAENGIESVFGCVNNDPPVNVYSGIKSAMDFQIDRLYAEQL